MTRPWNGFEELRFAARAVWRRPLFACAIAFLIALGIGGQNWHDGLGSR
jgi:hypothetical protein